MKAATSLISLFVVLVAFPAQAKDSDDLGSWSLDQLCENKDKRRHADAVFAELERREVFTSLDLARIRWGYIDDGMSEAALHCAWGAPDSVSHGDGASSQTYHRRMEQTWRTIDVFIVEERVTDIRTRPDEYSYPADPWSTFSGRPIDHPEGPINCLSRTSCR